MKRTCGGGVSPAFAVACAFAVVRVTSAAVVACAAAVAVGGPEDGPINQTTRPIHSDTLFVFFP